MTEHVTVRPIPADLTRGLRQQVLRPTMRAEELVYPGDDDPLALHVGAFLGPTLIGIASVYPQAEDGARDLERWRLRGMAVAPDAQRGGIGSLVIRPTIEHAQARGGRRYWCQARLAAVPFYERHGLATEGALFELPGIGPHYLMAVTLRG